MNLDYELFRTFVPRMKVLIINTYERLGGAAVAANRLMEALINNGVKAKMLVRDKQSDQLTVVSLPHPLRLRWNFLWERLVIFIYSHFYFEPLFSFLICSFISFQLFTLIISLVSMFSFSLVVIIMVFTPKLFISLHVFIESSMNRSILFSCTISLLSK